MAALQRCGRGKPREGVTYIVSGNGGNTLYEHLHPHSYTAAFYNQKPGLTLVAVDGAHLLRHLNVEDREIDRLELEKTPGGESSVRGAVQ